VTVLSDMVYRPWSLEGQRIDTRNVAVDIPTMDVGLAWRSTGRFRGDQALHDFLNLSFHGAEARRVIFVEPWLESVRRTMAGDTLTTNLCALRRQAEPDA